ncbi:Cloroperoxidase [Aspergillus steynii IBT 23096]|uniref:Cloroperoxidase n=1 Tax=Aspergillus steynii IBT 23096 TaxID=1392250 RepID=A0A2I2FZN3_9EURO|nr:Cloroperoxidase [Aspergillus steynii IBT 23096]PLB46088.1 Cloroperoxidase [Aspergillus steynii IBT 23096]
MKFTLFSSALLVGLAAARPSFGSDSPHWRPAGKDDFRGPCPMMNTLANHGYLPHDGRQITKQKLVEGLGAGLNFNSSLADLMFEMAIVANPEPNATYFTLDHLNRHNVLEHDGSLSRTDAFFGSNHIFNRTIFEESRAYWTKPVITAEMLANSKLARQISSRATNPTYTFGAMTEEFSLGEIAAPIIAFGDMESGTVNRSLVEYFFENERLPFTLGWARSGEVISQGDIAKVSEMIRNATSLLTGDKTAKARQARDLHSSFRV